MPLKDYYTTNFLQNISDEVHFFIADNLPDGFILIFQILAKLALLFALIYLIDFVLKIALNFFFKYYTDEEKFPFLKAIQKSKVTNSIAHILALFFGSFSLASIFGRHPQSFKFLDILINLIVVLVLANMVFRLLKAVEFYYSYKKDFYRIMALRAINQTVKVFGIFIFSIIGVSIIFSISGTTILGSLGAITAVLVLVFRDTILGFVTGLHVATSKNLKNGDWIGIPKYNLEGTIEDINLLTTKILNFDKTISTIPTYDLLSTEIKNLQVMAETNTRRVKKSIFFNINSFKFLDGDLLLKLEEINLISHYLKQKSLEISDSKKLIAHADKVINGQQLTNIGVFRYYAQEYLKQNVNVDEKDTLMVRQLEITPQGLPLEIYCFTNDSKWEHFEQIQADIFDHLLVASKEFELEVVQYTKL